MKVEGKTNEFENIFAFLKLLSKGGFSWNSWIKQSFSVLELLLFKQNKNQLKFWKNKSLKNWKPEL